MNGSANTLTTGNHGNCTYPGWTTLFPWLIKFVRNALARRFSFTNLICRAIIIIGVCVLAMFLFWPSDGRVKSSSTCRIPLGTEQRCSDLSVVQMVLPGLLELNSLLPQILPTQEFPAHACRSVAAAIIPWLLTWMTSLVLVENEMLILCGHLFLIYFLNWACNPPKLMATFVHPPYKWLSLIHI